MSELPHFLDPVHWEKRDKAWLASRKSEWKNIQHVLKVRGRNLYPISGHMAAFKAFFFKGEFQFSSPPQSLIKAGNGFITPRTLIWFHPNLNHEVAESIVNFHSTSVWSAHQLDCELVFRNARDSKYDRAYGMMGGREKLVVEILCSRETLKIMDRFDVSYRSYLGRTTAPKNLYGGLIHVLKGGTNPWHPGQYIWDYTMPLLDDVLQDDESRAASYLTLCKCICFFDEHKLTAKHNPHAIALREYLVAKFQNPEDIPASLLALWEQALDEGPD